MGNCMQNSNSSKKQKVKLNIKWTGVYDVDELFRAAAAPLQTLHEVSKSISKSIKAFKKLTFTHVVIDCTLVDSIFGMLYCFSANIDGVIDSIALRVIDSPPYIELNKDKIPKDVLNIYEAWMTVIEALNTAPGKLRELAPQIRELAEESKEFPDRAKDICRNNNMGPMEMLKASKRIMKNAQKIASAKRVLEETQESIEMLNKAVQGFTSSFEVNYDRVITVGKTARKENCLHPKQIVPKHWPELQKIDLKLDVPPKPKPQKK